MLNSTRRGSLTLGMNDPWVGIELIYISKAEAKPYIRLYLTCIIQFCLEITSCSIQCKLNTSQGHLDDRYSRCSLID